MSLFSSSHCVEIPKKYPCAYFFPFDLKQFLPQSFFSVGSWGPYTFTNIVSPSIPSQAPIVIRKCLDLMVLLTLYTFASHILNRSPYFLKACIAENPNSLESQHLFTLIASIFVICVSYIPTNKDLFFNLSHFTQFTL